MNHNFQTLNLNPRWNGALAAVNPMHGSPEQVVNGANATNGSNANNTSGYWDKSGAWHPRSDPRAKTLYLKRFQV